MQIHRLSPSHIALANARTVIRSREAQDRVTLLIACDVLDAYGDAHDRHEADMLRLALAPGLAATVNEAAREARNMVRWIAASAVASALIFAWAVAVDPLGRAVADVRQAQEMEVMP